MKKIKKIIGVIVIAMFLSTITLNISLFINAYADSPQGRLCLGWDGVTEYCGLVDEPEHVCIIEAECRMVCYKGCD